MTALDDIEAWVLEEAPNWKWRFASSFAGGSAEHAYVKDGMNIPKGRVYDLARLVWARGVPKKFYSKTNIELHLPELQVPFKDQLITGVKFWQMTGRLSKADLVNMAPITSTHGLQNAPVYGPYLEDQFDFLAPEMTDMWDRAGHQENYAQLWKFVQSGGQARQLFDFRAGFGAALDAGLVTKHPDWYVAIEPSRPQLNSLVYRNNWVRDVFNTTPIDFLENKLFTRMPVAVSLFGGASWLTPKEIAEISFHSDLAIFMHYGEDLSDDYFGTVEPPAWHLDSLREARQQPGALVGKIGRFECTVVRHA